ncbi:MAG: hypothetical protein CME62_07845 [Halobacteriovoraceae bacterium]|nr:hypothetical protein [Halobacteriovoraceae bacterium]|tara:strand:- start:4018 stop:5280 length:1263 start_codon:yes stop_codon:yes gene_type:complete
MKKTLFGLMVIALNLPAFACIQGNGDGYFPKNKMWIPPFSTKSILEGGITQQEFNSVLDKVNKVYSSIIPQYGGRLKIERLWNNGDVNAFAKREGSNYVISMYGGMARHSDTTIDSFLLVACHEVGHHIGGLPRYTSQPGLEWGSTEGQSDYFAVSKCMRKVLRDEDNESFVKSLRVPATVTNECEEQFSNANEIAMCKRISMAGMASAKVLASLRNSGPVSFDTPDTSEVPVTYESHPHPQCRLDTYFQGANCTVDEDTEIGQNNPNTGTCNRVDKFEEGLRPLCWYKPTSGGTDPNPNPPVGNIAKTPTVNGQTSVQSQNPNQIIPIMTDVSGFPGVAMIAIEVSKPNQTFSNPNSQELDRVNGLWHQVHQTVSGTYRLLPARQLPGWGTYQVRVIGLDRNKKPVSRNSNPLTIRLGR